MKKQNLVKISLSAAILAAAILFTGCPGEAEKPVENPETENPAPENPASENPSSENKTDKPSEEKPSTENPIDNPTEDPIEKNPTENPSEKVPTEESPIEDNPGPQVIFVPVPTLSFNMTNAEALAAVSPSSQDRSARTARFARAADSEGFEGTVKSSDSESPLQKILEDGTVEDAMDIEGGKTDTEWSNIDYVILPPENLNSSDVYLLMKGYTQTEVTIVKETTEVEPTTDEIVENEPTVDETTDKETVEGERKIDETTEDTTVEDEPTVDETVENETTEDEPTEEETTVQTIAEDKVTIKMWTLSPLICVHKDNTYDDVLLESPYDVEHFYSIDSKENIQFLKDGSLVYLIRGEGYNHFLKKWDPVTKQTTLLCNIDLPVEEGSLFVRSFSINKDEDYIYMYLDRVDANSYGYQYLKIIKISDSSFDKEIGNGFPGITGWCYNPYDDSLYYSKYSDETEPEQGLFTADKTGSTSEHLTSEMFSRLIPESAQKVWGVNSYDSGKFTIQNILSEKSETGFVEKFSYTAPEHYLFIIECDYIFANDNLYLNHRFYCDGTGGHKDAIIAIPLSGSDSDIKNLLAFNENISLHSWTVNEDSLFISGSDYETKEAVNCKIDLKTSEQVTIQSDSTFSSIAAF